MWQHYRMSKSLRKSPSELLNIIHPVRSFYFNRAVWVFGSSLEAALEAAAEGGKKEKIIKARQQMVLATWLGPVKGMYRDPARR
jgi:hypothetical protein